MPKKKELEAEVVKFELMIDKRKRLAKELNDLDSKIDLKRTQLMGHPHGFPLLAQSKINPTSPNISSRTCLLAFS